MAPTDDSHELQAHANHRWSASPNNHGLDARKRSHSPSPSRSHAGDDQTINNKRLRSANWPLPDDPIGVLQPTTANTQRGSPVRPSRFREGSMADRASEEPPTAFIAPPSSDWDYPMKDYGSQRGRTASPRFIHRPVHHTRASVSHSTTTTTTDESGATRQSGIFRFGRSVAASFNPVRIWQSVSNRWDNAKEELLTEAEMERKRLLERQVRAEQAYAELKASTARPSHDANRDSGIAMDDTPRASLDNKKRAEEPTPRRTFHFRTPSLTNLKRIRSEVSLHKRSVSGSESPSKDHETPGPGSMPAHELRRQPSKKDLVKQRKLTKRISDLETKLELARRELNSAMTHPPLPATPQVTPRAAPGPSAWKRSFAPMPSLPSERLLYAAGLLDDADSGLGSVDGDERPPLPPMPNMPDVVMADFEFEAAPVSHPAGVAFQPVEVEPSVENGRMRRSVEPELRKRQSVEPELRARRSVESELRARHSVEPTLRARRSVEPELRTRRSVEPDAIRVRHSVEPELHTHRSVEPEVHLRRSTDPEHRSASGPETRSRTLRKKRPSMAPVPAVDEVP
ncbi:hypothetical protein EJ06DRAFT_161056 [Trichodelitschia bisporula]|uniref:Uncharacterized protein n=1 Tax=Trichodelitschia bisporula TaxID=703511 RepID=A0A6G1HMH2_9PEZI|nr:hypothetical protein EJ06DRAFT_161056 [Trichodelitschia bisporula]